VNTSPQGDLVARVRTEALRALADQGGHVRAAQLARALRPIGVQLAAELEVGSPFDPTVDDNHVPGVENPGVEESVPWQ